MSRDEQEKPLEFTGADDALAESIEIVEGSGDWPINFSYGDYAYAICAFFGSATGDATRNADGSWTHIWRPDRHVTTDER